MSSYSLPKITPVLVRYKKPSGESSPPQPPRFLTSHCRPIWSDDSNRQPCGTQDTQGFFWFYFFFFFDGRSVRPAAAAAKRLWSVRSRHGRRATQIKFHKVARRTTSTFGKKTKGNLADFSKMNEN